ncbi:MAG: hypothetical protein J6A78_00315 [Clostridia bacterium]|nr:hypothetical protein [Clostridia bacterium]
MNYINCKNNLPPESLRKAIVFWCENSIQHIESFLSAIKSSSAVLEDEFLQEIKEIDLIFKSIYAEYSSEKSNLPSRPAILFKTNTRFIALLERIKLEAVSGYPILQQSVYHYIFEQNYINAIFGISVPQNSPIITVKFAPFYSNNCVFNQIYFWSVIGAMHPSLLLNNNDFATAINGYSKEYLRDTANSFNAICFSLSQMGKTNKKELTKIFNSFRQLNNSFLSFLISARSGSPKVFASTVKPALSNSFYKGVGHMINEHKLVSELCDGIAETIN